MHLLAGSRKASLLDPAFYFVVWGCCRSCLQDLTTNLYRIHDWRLEICDGQPISKNVGFSWHPGMYTLIANDAEIVRHILKDEFNKYTKPECLYDPFFFYFQDLTVTCYLPTKSIVERVWPIPPVLLMHRNGRRSSWVMAFS